MSGLCRLPRDVSALAEAELQRKLAASVADLRKGLAAARGLHANLRAEAAALEGFIPVIVEGAKSGMQQALAQQVGQHACPCLPASCVAACCYGQHSALKGF